MEISAWQTKVDDWIKQYGVRYFDIMTNSLLLVEEIGELSRYVARKYGEQSFKSTIQGKDVDNHIKDELGDIFFVLTCMCNQLDIDLTEVLMENMEKKTNRDNTRHLSNKKLR